MTAPGGPLRLRTVTAGAPTEGRSRSGDGGAAMWLGGVVVLLAAAVAVVTRLGREFRTAPTVVPWDIPAVASTYTGIVGALAGFTVASTVFLANLSAARETEAFVATMGMFLIAFVGFLVASQMFGTLPSRATQGAAGEDDALAQRLGFLLAIVGYYVALSIGWLGLRPLLLGLGLRSLADVFAWLLLAAVFAGAGRLGMFLYRLTRVGGAACLAVPPRRVRCRGGLPAGRRSLRAVAVAGAGRPAAARPRRRRARRAGVRRRDGDPGAPRGRAAAAATAGRRGAGRAGVRPGGRDGGRPPVVRR